MCCFGRWVAYVMDDECSKFGGVDRMVKKTATRTVTFKIAKAAADKIEKLTGRAIEDIAQEQTEKYLQDGRRQKEAVKHLGIAWPTDHYERALREWGERGIAENVRQLVYDDLMATKGVKVEPQPSYRELEFIPTKRKVKPNPGRKSTIQVTLMPDQWYQKLLDLYGDGNVSTYVKSLIYKELESLAKTNDKPLSVQARMKKYL